MSENKLQVGDKAPQFKSMAIGGKYGAEGVEVNSANFLGSPLVLYFYPKDNTPGCTTQACSLRDNWSLLKDKAEIFGVSIDSIESHKKFIDKFDLPFPLLSDSEKEVVNAFTVWVEKSMYGRKYFGVERSTFIIDEKGKIKAILNKVKPAEHFDQLVKILS